MPLAAVLAAVLGAGGLSAGCSTSTGSANAGANAGAGSAGAGATDPPVRIVASTDVYGDIATQIGGRRVEVTSIISSPGTDPHSYEANPRNQLALARAAIVIENGGGYDDFVDTMLTSAGRTSVTVLNAVDISGHRSAGTALNEHVWYDLPAMEKLAGALAAALSTRDAAGAATYRSNAASFTAKVTALIATETSIRGTSSGAGVAITEPVPLYMTSACGLVDRTPAAFSAGIENGTDIPPRVLAQTLDLFTHKAVRLLVYNEQTSGPQTELVVAAARTAGIAAVPVTETLPAGRDYISWMSANLDAIANALAP